MLDLLMGQRSTGVLGYSLEWWEEDEQPTFLRLSRTYIILFTRNLLEESDTTTQKAILSLLLLSFTFCRPEQLGFLFFPFSFYFPINRSGNLLPPTDINLISYLQASSAVTSLVLALRAWVKEAPTETSRCALMRGSCTPVESMRSLTTNYWSTHVTSPGSVRTKMAVAQRPQATRGTTLPTTPARLAPGLAIG